MKLRHIGGLIGLGPVALLAVVCSAGATGPAQALPPSPAPRATPGSHTGPGATAIPASPGLPPTPAASVSLTATLRPTAVPTASGLLPTPPASVAGAATLWEEKAQVTERAGNVLFVRPAGWQRKDNPDGSVVLLPPDLPPGRQCQLYIFSGDELRASLRERFDDAWRSLLNTLNARVVSGGEARMARGDGFDTITTTAVLRSARGASIYTTFFVAAPGTRVEAMVFLSDSEEQYEKHVAAMTTLVGAVRFANLQSAAPPVAVGPPAGPTAPGQRGLQVDSMYRSFQYRLVPGGRPGETRTSIEHLTFFTNGLVFRGWAEEGPGAVDPAADRDFFGTYKVVGDQVHIAWSYGRSVVFQRVADRLEERTPYARRDIYVLLPKVDGLRLQGTYVRRVDPSIITTPSWIAFARDGRFREQGLLALVLVNLRGEPLPPGGSGTYAIKDYTLELRYAGGYTKRIGFYIPGKPERPGQIFLNTYALDLQQ